MVVKDHVDSSIIINEMVRRSEESIRRIRYIEEFTRSLETKFDSLEDSMLQKETEVIDTFNDYKKVVEDLNKKLLKLENDVNNIKKALSKFVRKSEMAEIKSYVDMMNPLKSGFVTRAQVKEMIREAM